MKHWCGEVSRVLILLFDLSSAPPQDRVNL